jgi:hypothetical protein
MRIEEETAKSAICALLHKQGIVPSVTDEPNGEDTAPDYRLQFPHRCIDLEITTTGMGFINHPNVGKADRIKYEASAGEDFLLQQYLSGSPWVKPQESILVFILSPIPLSKRSKIAKNILKELRKRYESGIMPKYKRGLSQNETDFCVITSDFETSQIWIGASFIDSAQGQITDPLNVQFFASYKASDLALQNSLENQAEYVLKSIIIKKNEKCLSLNTEVWLAIINTHPMLSSQDYLLKIRCLQEEVKKSCFSSVFIIENGVATELINIDQASSDCVISGL